MPGSAGSSEPLRDISFLLDEGLPKQVAHALALVGYRIVAAADAGLRGGADPDVIQYASDRSMVWITKDHAARSEHEHALRETSVSVIWVRGLKHPAKNNIDAFELHRMLTDRLLAVARHVRDARGPRYFTLSYAANGRPVLRSSGDVRVAGRKPTRRTRRSR